MVDKQIKRGGDEDVVDPETADAVVDGGSPSEDEEESEWSDSTGDKDEVEDF